FGRLGLALAQVQTATISNVCPAGLSAARRLLKPASRGGIKMIRTKLLLTFLGFATIGAVEFGSSTEARAEAESAVPLLIWNHNPSVSTERRRAKEYGLPTPSRGTSRLEAELHGSVPVRKLAQVKRQMDELVAHPEQAEKLLGPGYKVIQ